jgi:hypothetical protein
MQGRHSQLCNADDPGNAIGFQHWTAADWSRALAWAAVTGVNIRSALISIIFFMVGTSRLDSTMRGNTIAANRGLLVHPLRTL